MVEVVGLGLITAVVAPVFQAYPVPPEAVRVAASPEQIFALPPMAAVGRELVETVMVVVEEQLPLETVTVYVVAPVGETTIGLVVAPVLHK